MREIKFRVWNFQEKRWMEDEILEGRQLLNNIFSSGDGEYEFLQYTGLKDNSGKEIYEGDIISIDMLAETESMNLQDECLMGVVEWDHAGFHLALETDDGKVLTEIDHDTIIIGNIYENPELLQ